MPLLRPKYFEGGIRRTIPSPSVMTMSGKRYNIAEVMHLAPDEAKTDSKTAVKRSNKSFGKRMELVPLSTIALHFGRCKEPLALPNEMSIKSTQYQLFSVIGVYWISPV